MHVRNANCLYSEAEVVWKKAIDCISLLKCHGVDVNKASLFAEYSTLLFAKSHYEEVSSINNSLQFSDCRQLVGKNEHRVFFILFFLVPRGDEQNLFSVVS